MKQQPLIRRPIPYRFYNATIGLLVLNIAFYLISLLAPRIVAYLALTPILVIRATAYWQIVTYMFVHGDFWHLAFNMLALFFLGTMLERYWSSKRFLVFSLDRGLIGRKILVFSPVGVKNKVKDVKRRFLPCKRPLA